MKTYLVGGAVRDALLNLPIKDRDWVVTGSTPEEMISLGFKPVGKSFPVFLHPETHEEYALARTERKVGHGYTGFTCSFSPEITIEEDLLRRDLTVNAIAQDKEGHLIDPYGGKNDLDNKQLKHISDAFSEDPLRVLRVARFAARFHSLGFTIAPVTLDLMSKIQASGELRYLNAERIWQELHRALNTQTPSIFLAALNACGALDELLPELSTLFKHLNQQSMTPNTLDSATQELLKSNATDKHLWAALFYEADSLNLKPNNITALCKRLKTPKQCETLALLTAAHASTLNEQHSLDPNTLLSLFLKADAFRQPDRLEDLLLITAAYNPSTRQHSRNKMILAVFQACASLSAEKFIQDGLKGPEIGEAMKNSRLGIIKAALVQQ